MIFISRYFAAITRDCLLCIWILPFGALLKLFFAPVNVGSLQSFAFSPDNKFLLVSLATKKIRMIDIETGQPIFTRPEIKLEDSLLSHPQF